MVKSLTIEIFICIVKLLTWRKTINKDKIKLFGKGYQIPLVLTHCWVLGNIPNGIITYNATVTISNDNVPVLGYQYGWNYTGGSNPILLITLPTQIIGTEGLISTASPAVGTTANTFVFGIQNNTAENVTVNYGYLKIS